MTSKKLKLTPQQQSRKQRQKPLPPRRRQMMKLLLRKLRKRRNSPRKSLPNKNWKPRLLPQKKRLRSKSLYLSQQSQRKLSKTLLRPRRALVSQRPLLPLRKMVAQKMAGTMRKAVLTRHQKMETLPIDKASPRRRKIRSRSEATADIISRIVKRSDEVSI